MSHPVFPVILSGGAGTRLWPLSREEHPKQFVAVLDDYTLLQSTARRLRTLERTRPPIVVCNEVHRFMVAEQLRMVGVSPGATLLEPMARGTAPAIVAAALEALAQCDAGDDPILLVLPSDHVIQDMTRFAEAVGRAIGEAIHGRLVAFGVVTTDWRRDRRNGYMVPSGRTGTIHDERRHSRGDPAANPTHRFYEDIRTLLTAYCARNTRMFVNRSHRHSCERCAAYASLRSAVRFGSVHENVGTRPCRITRDWPHGF